MLSPEFKQAAVAAIAATTLACAFSGCSTLGGPNLANHEDPPVQDDRTTGEKIAAWALGGLQNVHYSGSFKP